MTPSLLRRFQFDRALWLAMLLGAIVLIPRGYLISRVQSERVDDEYHLIRGAHFLFGQLVKSNLPLNDPPLGEAITALPLWLAGCWKKTATLSSALYGQKFNVDTILNVVAIWKSILFLPMVGVVFAWVRKLYSLRAAWLTTAMLLIEPTFAAHIPLPTLDVMGVEGIVIGCFAIWRFVQTPTWWRAIVAAFCIALAMLLKHTAILLPPVALILATIGWFKSRERIFGWRGSGIKLVVAAALVPFFIWALCGFERSRPRLPDTPDDSPSWASLHPRATKLLSHHYPAGLYIGSFIEANYHSGNGHPSFLFGERSKTGWWYYFPVVATFKVPIGIGIVLLIGVASLCFVKPQFGEVALLVPMIAWTALMMTSKIDIGFRHFLPAYTFMLMAASRVMLVTLRAAQPLAWIGVSIAAIHVALFHPDYLTYINFPRHAVWMDISDSNIDWGQGLKLARRWIDAHPKRQVSVREFGWGEPRIADIRRRLGKRAHIIDRSGVLPVSGVLIISPVSLASVYEHHDIYRELRKYEPIEILGNALRVYDLDAIRGKRPFNWHNRSATTAATRPSR